MDPVTQGTLGAVAAQNSNRNNKHLAIATLLGFLGGLAPDLDILIQSEHDPLLFLEYHRQFTHALIFIPIGGTLCAALCHLLFARWLGMQFRQTWLYCTAGYATHALLDACTSYGTQLFWPFSNMRVAWSTMSIIDPLFTLPLLSFVVLAAVLKKKLYSVLALCWLVFYMSFGIVQRERAQAAGLEIAQSRGHNPVQLEAKPGFGNQLLWKVVYEFEDRFYVDGIRAGFSIKHYPGDSLPRLDKERDFPWLAPDSTQSIDIDRFSWFSAGFVSVHPEIPERIIDVRYSMVPNEISAIWMIELDPEAEPGIHVDYIHTRRPENSTTSRLISMLLGRDL